MNIGVMNGNLETITLAQNSTKFGSILKFEKNCGFSAMLLTFTAGSLTVSQVCAVEALSDVPFLANFIVPQDRNLNTLGVVGSLLSAGTYYIQFDPVLSKFVRFKFVEANIASMTIQYLPVFLEDR